jgi:N-acylneuraminate cytidylyltransferase
MKFSAILLCKKNSERVKNKNTRKFLNYKLGLTELKIKQLLKTKNLDEIVLSTDDKKLINKYSNYNKKIRVVKRDKWLCKNNTSTDSLIKYVTTLASKESYILWTQVCSPLVHSRIYESAINFFKKNNKKFDSLVAVNKIQEFLWSENGPYNYSFKNQVKWPKTQDLQELYKINSAIFIFDKKIYQKYKDRVGVKPYFFVMKKNISTDVDTMEEFNLAKSLFKLNGKI